MDTSYYHIVIIHLLMATSYYHTVISNSKSSTNITWSVIL